MLALGSGAVANASETAHQGNSTAQGATVQSTSGARWYNQFNFNNMNYDSASNDFYATNTVTGTWLFPASACDQGWCEHTFDNNGTTWCMGYVAATNRIAKETCNGGDRQKWYLTQVSNGVYSWENLYADNTTNFCVPYLTVGGDDVLNLMCGESTAGFGGGPSKSQLWTPTS
jgi:hypothetical protein